MTPPKVKCKKQQTVEAQIAFARDRIVASVKAIRQAATGDHVDRAMLILL